MRLQNAGDALKSVRERILSLCTSRHMSNHKAGCPLIENDFPGMDYLSQLRQEALYGTGIWNEVVYYLRPGFIQTLIPNTGWEKLHGFSKSLRSGTDQIGTLLKQLHAPAGLDQVHLVY